MALAVCPLTAFTVHVASPPPRPFKPASAAIRKRPLRLRRAQERRPAVAVGASVGEGQGDDDTRLGNPRLPVPNEYLAGWALTQNDTACLERFREMGYSDPGSTPAITTRDGSPLGSSTNERNEGLVLWGDATKALMERVDIVRDLDQRRLAASRYWQRLQASPPATVSAAPAPAATAASEEGEPVVPALSWADVNALFESDGDFVQRERERSFEEAADGIAAEGGWREDRVSRQWVASYRLSMFETRRQAQRFFSWGIPDEGALDCILEPGKRVLEVGSGLGYWAYLLKLRSGDESRVRCFDPFAPPARRAGKEPSPGDADSDTEEGRSDAMLPPPEETRASPEEEEFDEWFGERRPPFTPADRGSFELIAKEDPEDKFRGWSLLICWPSDGRWPAGCLEAFEGDDFFYVGEAEGGATRMPWRLLRERWELRERVAIPNWPGFKDALFWYRRKGLAPLPKEGSLEPLR